MLVTGYAQAGRVTVSNTFFNGTTSWSASCNNEHYWTILLLGESDQISFLNNHVFHTSGRGPKVGGNVTLHAVNNFWEGVDGHAFDISEDATVLIEGNVFDNVKTPITAATADETGQVFNVPSGSASACSDYLGRDCVANVLTDSGDFAAYEDSGALAPYQGVETLIKASSTDNVADYVNANAGIGKLDASASSDASQKVSAAADETDTEEESAETTSAAPAATTSAAETPVTQSSSSSSSGGEIKKYMQCGGKGWSGSGSCEEGCECKEANEWYSQCL